MAEGGGHDNLSAFCPVCLDNFTCKSEGRGAVVVCPQGHLYCERCVRKLEDARKQGPCPECRTPRLAAPISIREVAQLSDAYAQMKAEKEDMQQLLNAVYEERLEEQIVHAQSQEEALVGRRIFVVGGQGARGELLKSGERLDLHTSFSSNGWRPLVADLPGPPRSGCAATAFGGRLCVVGGAVNSTTPLANVDIFEPSLGAWFSTTPMPTARRGLGVCATNDAVDRRLYAVGGWDATTGRLSAVHAFDPVAGTWSSVAELTIARFDLAVGIVDGEIYAIGGIAKGHAINSVEMYDRRADRWTPVPQMSTARAGLCVAVVGDQLYAIGGRDETGAYLRSIEAFDPTDGWRDAGFQLTRARWGAGAVADTEGWVYAVGGYNDVDGPLDSVEMFGATSVGRMCVPRWLAAVALL